MVRCFCYFPFLICWGLVHFLVLTARCGRLFRRLFFMAFGKLCFLVYACSALSKDAMAGGWGVLHAIGEVENYSNLFTVFSSRSLFPCVIWTLRTLLSTALYEKIIICLLCPPLPCTSPTTSSGLLRYLTVAHAVPLRGKAGGLAFPRFLRSSAVGVVRNWIAHCLFTPMRQRCANSLQPE